MMRRNNWAGWIAVASLIVSPVLLDQQATAAVSPGSQSPAASQRITATMMGMPLQFEANHGQVDAQVKFLSRGSGYTLFLTPTESVMVLQQREATSQPGGGHDPLATTEPASIKQSVVRMKLEGANPSPAIDGMEQLPGIVNYFIGNDPDKWRTKIPTYAKVQYKEAYPGIDLAYYGNQGKLEYDFMVAPGADPNQIKLAFEGASDIRVADSGDLLLTTALGDVRVQKPIVYQLEKDGHKTLVAGNYVASPKAPTQVGIQLATYDTSRPLVIDPTLFYSTYLGGSGYDEGVGIAVDASGNAYVTGYTFSSNFPTTAGAFQPTYGGGSSYDTFITKLNPTGSALVYSTYLGGSIGDHGRGIAVDAAGNAYVMGDTNSANFPITAGAFQPTYGGSDDGFITALNPTGSALVYSSYLGGSGSEFVRSIAVDAAGNAYVTGYTSSTNFPTTAGAFQPSRGAANNVFVTKVNPTGSALVYSTYLGGSSDSYGYGIAVDASGSAYVTGEALLNFPTTTGAFQSTYGGGSYDAFVTKVNPTGSVLVYSTYLGGSSRDYGAGIAVDASGNVYVTGYAISSNFPTTAGAFQPTFGGGSYDAFVTALNPTGSALGYSTYLGGNNSDIGTGIVVDALDNAYVTGYTLSTNFPTTAGAFKTSLSGSTDAFVTKVNPTGSALAYSTYLGGSSYDLGSSIAVDGLGNAYVTGVTASSNFSTTPGGFQTTFGGTEDAFVAKIIEVTLPPVEVGKVTGGGSINDSSGIGNFAFIVQRKDSGGPISGELTYQNKVSGAKIKSVSFTSFSITGNTAVFEGACTDNKAPCAFRVTMVDNGEPGTADTFTISISGGPIEGGTLRSGNVQIH